MHSRELAYLLAAISNLEQQGHHAIPSPPPGVNPLSARALRRSAVAVVLRVRPSSSCASPVQSTQCENDTAFDVKQFAEQEWVRSGTPEVLVIKRAVRAGDRWSGDAAFSGGHSEPSDGGSSAATAERETFEEVGLDLSDRSRYRIIGSLDDRTMATWFGEFLMVVSAVVYLQIVPDTPPLQLQPSEVQSAHWIPLKALIDAAHPLASFPNSETHLPIDLVRRVTGAMKRFRNPSTATSLMLSCMSNMVGTVNFPSIHIPVNDDNGNVEPLRLWGMSLGVAMELVERARHALAHDPSIARFAASHGVGRVVDGHPWLAGGIWRWAWLDIYLMVKIGVFMSRSLGLYSDPNLLLQQRAPWSQIAAAKRSKVLVYRTAIRTAIALSLIGKSIAAFWLGKTALQACIRARY
ncbi:hypothetical protein GQ42DRAFT_161452 [Ramicandelaber brevisporus]|nr:hypothetical protein GQ42DRAFT_161452 [Ramicandelaber brevisporus]